MKLLAPIAVFIAAASATQVYSTKSSENYAHAAEIYQSGIEQQQHGLYSGQSNAHVGYEEPNHRPSGEKTARILGQHSENDGHHYQYAYETENGIKAEEVGETLDKGTAAHGAYSYTGDDGQIYSISYTADENGFRPSGAHLPTPPPVPEEILKSLEDNARDEAAGIFDDGKYREHQELEHQDHQHLEADHQSVGYHSSGHTGADLAYHAHAPSIHSAARIVNQAPSTHGSNYAHHVSSGHSGASSSFYTPTHGASSTGQSSGHGSSFGHHQHLAHQTDHGHQQSLGHESSLGHQTSFGHGSSLGHQGTSNHETSLGHQATLSHGASLGHQAALSHGASLGHQASLSHGGNLGHQISLGHGISLGHQSTTGHEAGLSHASLGHGSLHSGFQASSGHASGHLGYSAPTGFSMPSAHGGISGHVGGLSYLPPSGHAGTGVGYHGHQ